MHGRSSKHNSGLRPTGSKHGRGPFGEFHKRDNRQLRGIGNGSVGSYYRFCRGAFYPGSAGHTCRNRHIDPVRAEHDRTASAAYKYRNAGNSKLRKRHYTAIAGGYIDGPYVGSDTCKQHRTERPHAYKRSYSAYRKFGFRHSFHASTASADGNTAYFEFGAGNTF